MPVNSRHASFYHIPKTGGVWITQAANQAGVQFGAIKDHQGVTTRHMPADAAHLALSGNRTTFTILRDPCDWLESCYRWMIRHRQPLPGPASVLASYPLDSFLLFANSIIRKLPRIVSEVYDQYSNVDFIGRTGDAEFLIRVLEESGEEFNADAIRNLPPKNVTADKSKTPCLWMQGHKKLIREVNDWNE